MYCQSTQCFTEIYAHTHPFVDVHCSGDDHAGCPHYWLTDVKLSVHNPSLDRTNRRRLRGVQYKSEEWEAIMEDNKEDYQEWMATREGEEVGYKVWTCSCECHKRNYKTVYWTWLYSPFPWRLGNVEFIHEEPLPPPRPNSWMSHASQGLQVSRRSTLAEWMGARRRVRG